MITVLHGDNIEASRNELFKIKSQSEDREIITLDGRKPDETEFTIALEASSLFGNSKIVIIEKLFSSINARSKNATRFTELIAKSSSDVVLFEDKQLTLKQLELLGKNVIIREFMIPKVIFQFLDGIKPNNQKSLIILYNQVHKATAPELIFYMIVKRIEQLLSFKKNEKPDGLQSWQIARLTTQANFFTMDKLLLMQKNLLKIDYSIKSGVSPLDYRNNLELFLLLI
jgi:hypothetical protein